VYQIVFVYLDDPETFRGIAIEEGTDHGRFPGAASAPQENMVGGKFVEELDSILNKCLFLFFNAEKIVKVNAFNFRNRFQIAGKGVSPPVGGMAFLPVDLAQTLRQENLHCV
jgi:hypothetical protein